MPLCGYMFQPLSIIRKKVPYFSKKTIDFDGFLDYGMLFLD